MRRVFVAGGLLPPRGNEGRQEGVKKGCTVPKPHSESSASQAHLRSLLIEVMRERGESLAEFGATLARTIDAGRAPFSRQYVHRLKVGQDPITAEIAQAIQVLGAMLDGVNELQARAQYVRVLAIHPLPGDVIVLGAARGCALAGCRIQFVPASPAQRYCSPECRREADRRRREVVG